MQGWKIVAARRALARMIDTLTDADRFCVLAFDNAVETPRSLPAGLSAATVTRLKAASEAEHDAWSKRSLKGKHYVYVWADGVHFNIRLEAHVP